MLQRANETALGLELREVTAEMRVLKSAWDIAFWSQCASLAPQGKSWKCMANTSHKCETESVCVHPSS